MFKKLKLSNGLTLILDQDKTKYCTTATIDVLVGGLDTHFKISGKDYHVNYGIAHLLEHYLLEESIYGNMIKVFGDNYIKTNGGTSLNETYYYIKTVHHFKNNFIKLLNIVNNPKFRSKNLDSVKNPIIQEIKGDADSTGKLLSTAILSSVFKPKTADAVLGSEDDLKKITIDELKFYHEVFYTPSNQIITISGNFPDNIVEIIENEYEKYNFKNYDLEKIKISEPKDVITKYQVINDKSIPEKMFQISYKIDLSDFTPLECDKIDYYLDYLYCNNFSDQSELFDKLHKNKSIIYSIGEVFNPNIIKKSLLFGLKVYADDYEKIIELVKEQIKNPLSDLKSFERWKNREIIIKIHDLEESEYKANNYINNLLLYNLEEYDTLEFVQNFNLEECQELLARIDFSHYTIVVNDNDK